MSLSISRQKPHTHITLSAMAGFFYLQKEDYVNQFSEDFTGLVVHLTMDDPIAGDTFNGKKNMSQTEYDELKRQILGTLDSPPASAVA